MMTNVRLTSAKGVTFTSESSSSPLTLVRRFRMNFARFSLLRSPPDILTPIDHDDDFVGITVHSNHDGADAYNAENYPKALEHFQKLVGDFPEAEQVSKAYFYMAESHFNLEQHGNAVTAYKNFLINFPKDPNRMTALFRLGVSQFQAEKFGESVIAFNNVLEADPESSLARDALLNIAVSYKRMGQPNQAIESYERLLVRFPDDPDRYTALLSMGSLHEEIKNYEAALKNYQAVADSAPESMDALAAQGRIYSLLKLPNQQIAVYERLRNKSPRRHAVRLSGMVNLAELYQDLGKIHESISVYEDIADNTENPDWQHVARNRAQALRSELQ